MVPLGRKILRGRNGEQVRISQMRLSLKPMVFQCDVLVSRVTICYHLAHL